MQSTTSDTAEWMRRQFSGSSLLSLPSQVGGCGCLRAFHEIVTLFEKRFPPPSPRLPFGSLQNYFAEVARVRFITLS